MSRRSRFVPLYGPLSGAILFAPLTLHFQHHAKTNIFEDEHSILVSTWTHVARKLNPDANANDTKTQGVTARDIRLAYALETLFETALAASGEDYVPRLRPEADRPRTLELEGYS